MTSLLAAAASLSPDLHEMNAWGEHARNAKVMLVLLQAAALLGLAKGLGYLAERAKIPGVIGELSAGILIGPYILGSRIPVSLLGHAVPLFPAPTAAGQWPVNDVIWSVSQVASVILLFATGLHTDLRQFLKYVMPASAVAVAGLVIPFGLGVAVVMIPAFAAVARGNPDESALVPALFAGAILAATSIGITARVLKDIGRLASPEGVTILGAAVLDDVLGIIALAIVGGIAEAGTVSAGAVLMIAAKAIGFWVLLTGVIFALSKPLDRLLQAMDYAGAPVGIALAIAMLCSGLAENFGLAFIIGAYSAGLGLSRAKIAHRLLHDVEAVGTFFVPLFFATLGMLVDPRAMFSSSGVVMLGACLTVAAIVGKVVGCGAAALPVGFDGRGAWRIGVGMLPRGEVALIVAGIGLARGLIGEAMFGVSILMTLVTTVLAPILLVPAFRDAPKPEAAT